ncbi:MAG: type II toxin-antitoxin system antitoxin SocA domain-containing protein [Bacteroidota bacterium]
MKSPFTGGEALLRKEWAQQTFRGDTFDIYRHYYVCADTQEEFSTQDLDELNTAQVYNQYRALYRIPFPSEITEIRERYGLSAARMSEVLDFGINSYRKYELGEIPSLANAKLIKLARNPETLMSFAEEKRALFSSNAFQRLENRLAELNERENLSAIVGYIWNHHMEANRFTGYVKPNFEKVANFVMFFAQRCEPLKTRMNKLLFYCDFYHYKKTGLAISGCNYRAIQMGPVPSHFHELFGILESEGYVRIEEKLFEHGGVGEQFYLGKDIDRSLFSEDELASMEEIATYFEEIRTRQMITLSHEEEAWKENEGSRQLIDYQKYAFDLKAL